MMSKDEPTTLALVAVASSVMLAVYSLKLRVELAKSAPNKQAGDTTSDGSKLCTAEQLIAERRSVFPEDFDTTRAVPRAIINKMLEAANWAPTHKRTEPWRFVVFESPEKRRELGELLGATYKNMVPEEKFIAGKYKKILSQNTSSSHAIAICMKRQASGNIPEWEELCAVAMAVQNMHLVAAAHGVGAYWCTGLPIVQPSMKPHFKLDGEQDKCLGIFFVGWPKKDAKLPKGARRPIEDKVTWVD